MTEINLSGIWDRVREELSHKGIDLDVACCDTGTDARVKVVCLAGGLGESLREMGKTPRDQVVMVRIDEETTKKLDAWLETGAFKSRSEAAALFIREGLKVHARELQELGDALDGVEEARERLRRKARDVFSGHTDGQEDSPEPSE